MGSIFKPKMPPLPPVQPPPPIPEPTLSAEEKEKIASEIPFNGEVYPHLIEVGQIK